MHVLGLLAAAAAAKFAKAVYEEWRDSKDDWYDSHRKDVKHHHKQHETRVNYLDGNCPHCNNHIKAPAQNNAIECPYCNKVYLVIQCNNCQTFSCVPHLGKFTCVECRFPIWVGICTNDSCLHVHAEYSRTTSCQSCNSQVTHMVFSSEEEYYKFILSSEIALSLLIAKAEGELKETERRAILQFYRDTGMNESGILFIDKLIEEIRNETLSLEDITSNLYEQLGYQDRLELLQYLFTIIIADNIIDDKEIEVIKKISKGMGIFPHDFSRIYEQIHDITKSDENVYRGYYTILGVQPDSTSDDIKRAYRDLVHKYHPDKFNHLGPEFAEIASVKFREIQTAYEKIQERHSETKTDRPAAGNKQTSKNQSSKSRSENKQKEAANQTSDNDDLQAATYYRGVESLERGDFENAFECFIASNMLKDAAEVSSKITGGENRFIKTLIDNNHIQYFNDMVSKKLSVNINDETMFFNKCLGWISNQLGRDYVYKYMNIILANKASDIYNLMHEFDDKITEACLCRDQK